MYVQHACEGEQAAESNGPDSVAKTLNLAVSCQTGSKCTVHVTVCQLVNAAASQEQEIQTVG